MSTPGRRDEVRAGLQVSARLPVAQSYLERRPSQALAGLVSSVWIQRASPGTAPFTHRNFPNGSVGFLCEVGSVPQIVGPRTRPRVEVLPPGSNVVGIRFRPRAAVSVLGVPASELAGLALDAEDLWGRAPAVPEAPPERTCSLRTVRWRGVRPGVRRGRETGLAQCEVMAIGYARSAGPLRGTFRIHGSGTPLDGGDQGPKTRPEPFRNSFRKARSEKPVRR